MQQSTSRACTLVRCDLHIHHRAISQNRLQCGKICRAAGADSDHSLDGRRSKKALKWSPLVGDAAPAREPKVVKNPHMTAPLGVDFGKVRIGLATCPGGFISAPLQILNARQRPWLELAKELVEIAHQQGLDGFVVGLPVTSRGNIHQVWTDSVQGRACRNFAQTLHAVAKPHSLPVYLFDESQTSSEAAAALGLQNTSRLKQQGKLDAVAAALILTAYCEHPEAAIRIQSIGPIK